MGPVLRRERFSHEHVDRLHLLCVGLQGDVEVTNLPVIVESSW